MRVLFTPGPVNSHEKLNFIEFEGYSQNQNIIKDALINIQRNIKNLVAGENSSKYEVILFPTAGSGTIEAVLSSIGYAKILNIVKGENGGDGLLMNEISSRYRKTSKLIYNESGEIYGLDYKEIENELDNVHYSFATVVHIESTTGILNDIKKIGSYCANNNTKLILDACTSFGAIPIDMKAMNIAILIGCFDKCVEGVYGLSFVVIEKSLLSELSKLKKETFYFDLSSQHEFLVAENKLRFLASAFSILINNLALILLIEETVGIRYERYKDIWKEIIKKSLELDIEYVVPEELQSKIITAFHQPAIETFEFEEMFEFLEENGLIIHHGKLLDFPTFRLANMGQISKYNVKKLFIHINEYLTTL